MLLVLGACNVLPAATVTWSGAGGDDNWSTAANWGGTAPVAGDDLVFAGTTRATPNNNLTAATSFASITFSAGATAFTIGGNSITLAGNLTNSSSAAQVINLAVILSGAPVISCASNPLTLGGIVSGSGSLTVSGASTVLTLSVNNTYAGGTTISLGAVNAGGTGLGTGLVTVAAGATLTATGGTGVTSRYFNVTPTNSGNVNPNFAALTTLQTHLNGQTLAVLTNASTLNFGTTGSNFPSPYNSSATNFEAYYSAKLTIASTATYTFNTSSDDGSMLFVDGTVVVGNNFFQSVVTRTGSISLTAGVHDLVVAFYQGTSGYGMNAQISGAGNVTMVDLSTANAALAPTHLEVASLAGAGSVVLTNGDLVVGRDNTSTTFSGVISGSNGVTKLGTGTLTLTGTNTLTGTSRVTAGTLQIGAGGTVGTIGSGAVINNGTLTFARSDAVTASNVISGIGTVVVNGSGTLTMNGTSTYTGATTVSQGTLQASGCALGTGAVTVAAGAILAVTGANGLAGRYFNVTATSSNFASLPALQTHLSGQTLALAKVATTMNFGSTGTSFPAPYNSGTPVFEAIYSGRLTIGTAGTYTFNTGSDDGSMLFVDGAVVVNNNFSQSFTTRTASVALTSGAHDLAVAFYNGAGNYGMNAQISGAGNTIMVDISTANATLTPDLIIGSLAGAGTVQLTDGNLISGFNGTSTTFSGTISGACGLVKRGSGTLTFSGTGTYTGTTTAAGGTFKLASGSGLGNTAITVCSAATFAPNPGSGTIAVGTTGAGTAGASLTMVAGAIVTMVDSAVGTCNLQQNTSFATTPLTISGDTMNFDISSAGTDTLAATLGATTSGTNSIGMTTVGANLTIGGSYPLITATSGLAGATWQFTGGGTTLRVVTGSIGYILVLSSSATAVTVTVGDSIDIWNGTASSDWNTASNWSLGTVPTGNNDVQIGNGSGPFQATPSVTAAGGICQSLTFTGSAAAVGAGSGTLTIGSGGLTASVAGSSIACPVALGATQTWTSTVNAVVVSGVVSGAFALTKAGTGTVTLSGANTCSAGVTLSAGTLNINNAAALGAAASTFTIANGTTIDNTSGGAITIAANNPMAWSGDFTFTGSNALNLGTGATALGTAVRQVTVSASTLTVGGVVSGTGGVNKTGSGTLALNGADTFTGGMTLTAGTLAIGNAAALGAAASTFTIAGGTVDNTSGGALTIANNNPQSWSGDFTFTGTNALNLGTGAVALGAGTRQATVAASTLTVGGIISGTGAVTKLGGGTLTLNGANTYSGGLTVSAGTLNIGNAAALGATASTFTIAGGTTIDNSSGGALSIANKNPESWTGDFTFTGTNALNLGGGAVALGAATRQVTVSASTLTVGGMIGGIGGLTKAGSGILALSALSTYTGASTILAGTVSLVRTSVTGFGTTGTGWTLNGGATVASDVLTLTSNASNQARSAFFNTKVAEAGFTATFQYQASGNKTADGAAFILQNSAVTSLGASGGQLGYSGITPSVALAFNLFASNTTGTRYFTNGTVTTPYTTNSPVVLTSGDPIAVTLTYDGTANLVETLTDLTTTSTFSTTLAAGTIATTLTSANAFVGFSGGTGGSTATQTISNFIYTSGGALPAATALTIASGATLDLGGCPQTVASLADSGGSGSVTNSGSVDATLTVSGTASTSFSGVISDGGTNKSGLTKSGSGTLTLSGTHTYTGATTVSGGTLLVSGATAAGSAVTASAGGTLAGTGTVAGTVTMGATGTLAPGTGGTTIGTLTTGTLSGNATSIFSIDLDGAGPTCDRATTAGTVACAGTLTVASAGNAALGRVYTILSAGTVTGTFSGLVNGAMTTQQGRTFQIAYTGTAVTLTDVARPTTRVWDGGGGDNNWTTAANWDFDLAPVAGEDLQFAGSTRTSPNNDFASATSFASITFNSAGSAFTVAGNAMTLAGPVTNSSANTQTINLALAIAAVRTINCSGANMAFGGVVSGAGGVAKSGANSLTLNGTSTYSGGTAINAGTIVAPVAASLGSGGGVSVAGTLNLTGGGNTSYTGLNTLSGAGTVNVTVGTGTNTVLVPAASDWSAFTGIMNVGVGAAAGAGKFIPSQPLASSATINVLANATVYLNSAITQPCTVVLNGGDTGESLGQLRLESNATWSGAVILAGAVTGTGDATIGSNSGTGTISGTISETGGAKSLSKAGTGIITLAGTGSYSGTTLVSAGTLQDGAAGVIPDGSAVTVSSGATWNLNNFDETVGSLAGAGAVGMGSGNLTLGGDNTSTAYSGVVSGTGNITKTGSGTYTISGTATMTGKYLVSAGLISASNGVNFRPAPGAYIPDAITLSGGGLIYTLTTTPNSNRGITIGAGGGSISALAGTTLTLQMPLPGAGNLIINSASAGTVQLSAANSYAGTTTVSGGILQNTIAGVIPDGSAMTVAVGALYDLNNFSETIGSLAGSGNVTLGSATLTCGGDNTDTTLSGVISGTGGLTKTGNGTLTLAGTVANTASGTTSVANGTLILQKTAGVNAIAGNVSIGDTFGSDVLRLGANDQIADSAVITFISGLANNSAKLELNGYVETVAGIQSSSADQAAVIQNTENGGAAGPTDPAVLTISNTVDCAYDGLIRNGNGGSGSMALGKAGSGTLTLRCGFSAHDLLFTGGVTISAGKLVLDNLTALSSAIIDSSAAADALTFIQSSRDQTYAAALSGSGAVTKTGASTLTLSGTDAATGAMTVGGGTLLVTGSTSAGSAVTVASGASLGGTGTVAGTVALAAGSTLAPGLGGTAIGTLTTGSVTCNATSTFAVDLDGTTPTNDRENTAGTVACAGTLTVASNANAAVGKVYTIVSAGTVSGTFSGLATNTVFAQAGRLFRIAYTSTAVTLTDCAPVLSARQTLDADGNGHLDRIRLTFDLALNDDTSALTVTVAGYTVTGFSTGAVANDNQIDVLVTELGAGDTGATPAVRITANTSLKHALGSGVVQIEGSATAATDTAAPVLLSTAWTDGGTGGVSAGDTVTLTFSESVTATAMTVADLGLPVTSDSLSTTTIANQTSATITMSLAGSPRLTPGGTYSAAATGAGKPSGVFIASGAHLQDAVGLAPAAGNAASARDLGPGTSTVAISWATGSDPRTWALGTLTVGTIANSIASGIDLTVQDTGDCNVDLSIASAATAPSNWGPAASAGANAYLMKAGTSAAATGAPTNPASYALTLTTTAQALTSGLLSGATSAYALYFQAPTTITSGGSATQQTIVISITAALAP
ncbi:MAG: autotransporter-associated beta strand repeat-containing protein [Planctomycetes bacterium]|nr:autotransporter-associated beta strand repeat-containing protein [Planctomycetota bacterium]